MRKDNVKHSMKHDEFRRYLIGLNRKILTYTWEQNGKLTAWDSFLDHLSLPIVADALALTCFKDKVENDSVNALREYLNLLHTVGYVRWED